MDLRNLWTAALPAGISFEPLVGLHVDDQMKAESLSTRSPSDRSPDTHVPISSNSSVGEVTAPVRTRSKPMPRKGHTKSRRGCFGCKRRKIKCSELKPFCENCQNIGLECQYPRVTNNRVVNHASVQQPQSSLQSTPTNFSMRDMRFFHHFLIKAYPHLPVGEDNIWTLELPAIAHEHDYLLHAMLALGASHLTISTNDDCRLQALSHRVKSVECLNKALSRPSRNKEEVDARFAAFMVLTFESNCMPEGLVDFLTMLRGGILNGEHLGPASLFYNFAQERYTMSVDTGRFQGVNFGEIDAKTLREAMESLAAIEPLCQQRAEKDWHKLLTEILVNGCNSPKDAYMSFVKFYNSIGSVSHADFQLLVDLDNPVSQLLLGHFLADHIMLQLITMHEVDIQRNDISSMYRVMLDWVANIEASLPLPYKRYNHWPRSFIAACAPDILAGRPVDFRIRKYSIEI